MRLTAFLNFLPAIPAFSPPVPAVNIVFPWACAPPKLNIPELLRLLLVAVGAKLKPAVAVALAAGVLLAPNEGVPPPGGANANGDDPVLGACAEKLKPPEAGGVGAAKLNPALGPEEPNGVVIALADGAKRLVPLLLPSASMVSSEGADVELDSGANVNVEADGC